MSEDKVKRYECANGGTPYCYGCYQMTRDDEYGDYVEYEDYAKLLARIDALGETLGAVKEYYKAMDEADNAGDYESAAVWRDKLDALLEAEK